MLNQDSLHYKFIRKLHTCFSKATHSAVSCSFPSCPQMAGMLEKDYSWGFGIDRGKLEPQIIVLTLRGLGIHHHALLVAPGINPGQTNLKKNI